MTTLPRLLVIMGSGETAPTMVSVHREVFARMGDVPAVLLDTTYGFQENADELSGKAVEHFARSAGRKVDVASMREPDGTGIGWEAPLARLREAGWVFSGPGSPTYALRAWRRTPVPDLLASKLTDGGCLVFASAAALTIGVVTLPVYEIYKAGEPPRWLEGMDLLALAGLRAAVIPHFDNAEGGTHDTRYCYLGERRLRMLEEELPEDTFVLGVDEHTACIIDVGESTLTVRGRGGVTVRAEGRATVFTGDQPVPLDEVRRAASAVHDGAGVTAAAAPTASPGRPSEEPPKRTPLMEEVARLEHAFDGASSSRDASGATDAVLALEQAIEDWSGDTFQSDEPDRARATLRSMIVRLGEAAVEGVRDPRERLAPLVDAVLAAREKARADRRWEEADALRDSLLEAGVEVRDEPGGTTWDLR
jgi:cyanophycinase-like exopeptidase